MDHIYVEQACFELFHIGTVLQQNVKHGIHYFGLVWFGQVWFGLVWIDLD